MNEGGVLLEEEKQDKRFFSFSTWWVGHRALLKRLLFGVFILFDVLLISYASWHLLDAFAVSYESEQMVVAQMVARGQFDLHSYTVASSASDIDIENVKVISIGDNRYDFYALIQNNNSDWWADYSYHFEDGDFSTEIVDGFILPGSDAHLTKLAVESSSPLRGADVVIDSIEWHRVDHHMVSDYETWSGDRLNLKIEDARFEKQTEFEKGTFGRTTFRLTNQTAYSYYDASFLVLLKRGSSVVGVNKTVISNLESEEEIDVALNWFGVLPSVNKVEVIPIIHIFDIDSYKSLIGETSIDTRTRVFR
jgi:hypothetical protein